MAKRKALTELHVALTASTQRFRSSMKSASSSMTSFQSAAKRTSGAMAGLKKAIGPLAAAAGIGSISVGIGRAMKSIDDLAKSSDRLGITTQALAGLRHAANQMGASSEELDRGLANMNRQLSDAAAGSGTAKDALQRLGLDAQQLAAMEPDRAFRMISDALGGVENQSDKTAIAFDIFGRSGVKLLNTMSLGSAGLDAMAAEADQLGLSLSRIDAAQVEAANDAIDEMRKALSGVFTRLSVDLAPTIVTLTESVKALGMGANETLGNSEGRLGVVSSVIGAIGDAVQGTRLLILKAIRSVLGGLEKVGRFLGLAMEELGYFNAGLDQTIEELMTADSFSERIAKNHKQLRLEAEKAAEASKRQAVAMDDQVAAAAEILELDRERDPIIESMRRAGGLMPADPLMGPEFPGLGGPVVPEMPDRGGFRIVDNLANLSNMAATTGRDTTAAVNHLTGEVGRLIGFLREGGVSVALTGVEV